MCNGYSLKLKKYSEQLISHDCATVSALFSAATNNSVLLLLLLPYVALFCREVQEFYEIKMLDIESETRILDLRNTIKQVCSRYNKTENSFIESDAQQDQEFREMLRFDFTKTWNIHYNLGVYYDVTGNIIGNTQFIAFCLDKANIDGDIQTMNAYKIGKSLGEAITHIRMLSGSKKTPNNIEFDSFITGHIDYNTNVKNGLFKYTENKGINLFLLHILSALGTSKYAIRRMLSDWNTWELRIEYIIAHNTWTGLKIIKDHYQTRSLAIPNFRELVEIVDKGRMFFPSSFRNAMFHYSLFYNEYPCIDESLFRPDILLFGLVETCFDGKTAFEYFEELRCFMNEVEDYLKCWFSIDKKLIEWDC